MKDSEFIELLNLYLDHEIGADDAARLEAEVQGNPARRRLYRDYCRMQKGCKILAQDFASNDTAEFDPKVVAFPQQTSRRTAWYVGGTVAAAAACVAFVFVSHRRAPIDEAAPAVAQSQPIAADALATNAAPAARRGIERGNAGDLSLRRTDANLAFASAAQNDPHFAWMQSVQLAPLPASIDQPLNLKAAPSPKLENRSFVAGNKTLPDDLHWTAVRFQR